MQASSANRPHERSHPGFGLIRRRVPSHKGEPHHIQACSNSSKIRLDTSTRRDRGAFRSLFEAAQSGIGLRGAVEVKGRIGIGQD